MSVFACICLYLVLMESRTGSCESLRGFWELTRGPLEEQPMVLTTELPLYPLLWIRKLKRTCFRK